MTEWQESTKQPYNWKNPIEIPQLGSKPMTQPRCDQCRWWDKADDAEEDVEGPDVVAGKCKRRCPQTMDTAAGHLNDGLDLAWGYWPMTFAADWCGEFQPTPKPPPQ